MMQRYKQSTGKAWIKFTIWMDFTFWSGFFYTPKGFGRYAA